MHVQQKGQQPMNEYILQNRYKFSGYFPTNLCVLNYIENSITSRWFYFLRYIE